MNSGYLRVGILDQRVVGEYYKFVVYPGSRRLPQILVMNILSGVTLITQ
jgi:hypothetical protein